MGGERDGLKLYLRKKKTARDELSEELTLGDAKRKKGLLEETFTERGRAVLKRRGEGKGLTKKNIAELTFGKKKWSKRREGGELKSP